MYIDPNTGGMLAGILLSLFGVISATVLVFAGRIKMFFAKLRRKGGDVEDMAVEDTSEE